MMKRAHFFLGFVVIGYLLFIYFIFANQQKYFSSTKNYALIIQGKGSEHLRITDDAGNEVGDFSLPPSDLFDSTGKRQINLHYLDKKAFITLAKKLKNSRISVNGKTIENAVVTRLHEKALSITLPHKRLYILAPPYMKMAVRALKFERAGRQDIFSCRGRDDFCRSVKVSHFEGMTYLIDKILKEDSFFGQGAFPRGRWAESSLKLFLESTKTQEAVIYFTLNTPIHKQVVKLMAPKNAQVVVLNQRELAMSSDELFDYVFYVRTPLQKGENTIKLTFGTVTGTSVMTPMPMAGVFTHIEVASGLKSSLKPQGN